MSESTWFEQTAKTWFEMFLIELKDQPVRFLQLGAFLGDASEWMLENVLTHPQAGLMDVDTFQGSPELLEAGYNWEHVKQMYYQRLSPWMESGKLATRIATTHSVLPTLRSHFDFIYVDASHEIIDALSDGLGAFRVLRPGGLIAFDDYTWPGVARAVDLLKIALDGQLDVIGVGSQCWMRKREDGKP